jgi:hypothetical protein
MEETEMSTRTLTAICLSVAFVASVNAAHAGFVKNVAKVAKVNLEAQKLILDTPLSAKKRLALEGKLAKVTAKCLVKAATEDPCKIR